MTQDLDVLRGHCDNILEEGFGWRHEAELINALREAYTLGLRDALAQELEDGTLTGATLVGMSHLFMTDLLGEGWDELLESGLYQGWLRSSVHDDGTDPLQLEVDLPPMV